MAYIFIKQYNFVPAEGRLCFAAWKVISGYPPTGSWPKEGRWALSLRPWKGYGTLCLYHWVVPLNPPMWKIIQF